MCVVIPFLGLKLPEAPFLQGFLFVAGMSLWVLSGFYINLASRDFMTGKSCCIMQLAALLFLCAPGLFPEQIVMLEKVVANFIMKNPVGLAGGVVGGFLVSKAASCLFHAFKKPEIILTSRKDLVRTAVHEAGHLAMLTLCPNENGVMLLHAGFDLDTHPRMAASIRWENKKLPDKPGMDWLR